MIWDYLSREELQNFIGSDLLNRLERIIPIIRPEVNGDFSLYKKSNLVNMFNTFVTVGTFRKKSFRETWLNSLPTNKLQELCELCGIEHRGKSFKEQLNIIVNKGWNDRKFCEKVLIWANLPFIFLPQVSVDIPNEESLSVSPSPYKVLKDYQFNVFLESKKELENPLTRFVIQMPTGSGKTRTAMEFITDFLNNSIEDCAVLWLAHSSEICEQSLQCFKDVWFHVATKPIKLFRCWGEYSSLPYAFSGSAFIVGGFQKLYYMLQNNQVPFDEMKKRIRLIIVDEAHKVIAPTYKKVTKSLLGNNTKVIGLTATPGRGVDNISQNEQLSKFFFNKILTIPQPEGISIIGYLREKKILAKLKSDPLISGRTYELTVYHKQHIEKFFDFPTGFLNTIAADDVRNLEIIKRLDNECKNGCSAIFFACSIDHSKFICSMLLYLGHNVAHIDGSTDKGLRKQYLEDFKIGKIQVICNYGVLSTGFDAPKTDLIFISRPTTSIVLYSQMLGRGLRGPAIGGTDECKLIDVIDNIIGFPSNDFIYNYFEDYWKEDG